MEKIVIGVDPHKLSATIEVIDLREGLLGSGRFTTDKAGFDAMRSYVSRWSNREWAVEGSLGVGRPLSQRLLEAGERVVDVPAKLAARARILDTGHGRKTDAHDAHSVAVAAVRARSLRVLVPDPELESLRMLVDHRDQLARQRIASVNRLHALLAELTPGKSKKDLTALQAKAVLASVRPRDLAGKTRRRIAASELANLMAIEKETKALTKEVKGLVAARGSNLMDLPGVGPIVAARVLADVGDVAAVRGPEPVRLMDRNRTPRRVVWRAEPAPALASRQPSNEPNDPHRCDHPDPPRHRGPRLLPTQARRRQDPHGSHPLPQATNLRRSLPPARHR